MQLYSLSHKTNFLILYFEVDFKYYKKLKINEASKIFQSWCKVVLSEIWREVSKIIPKIELCVSNLQAVEKSSQINTRSKKITRPFFTICCRMPQLDNNCFDIHIKSGNKKRKTIIN